MLNWAFAFLAAALLAAVFSTVGLGVTVIAFAKVVFLVALLMAVITLLLSALDTLRGPDSLQG